MVFDHQGLVDHGVVHRLLALAEETSLEAGDPVAARKRLFNVLTEGLENIHHHHLPDSAVASFARMVRAPWGYRLVMGNVVPAATAALLSHRVDILNEMDDAELKSQYLKLLSMQERTEHGGAGLGLITMARKSDGPIRTHCRDLGDGTVCFALELTVRVA